jgi:hypothetical protein
MFDTDILIVVGLPYEGAPIISTAQLLALLVLGLTIGGMLAYPLMTALELKEWLEARWHGQPSGAAALKALAYAAMSAKLLL